MTTVREVDLGRPAFKANPYPFYARLRRGAGVSPRADEQAERLAGDAVRRRRGAAQGRTLRQ